MWSPCPVLYDIAITCEKPRPTALVLGLREASWSGSDIGDMTPVFEYNPNKR